MIDNSLILIQNNLKNINFSSLDNFNIFLEQYRKKSFNKRLINIIDFKNGIPDNCILDLVKKYEIKENLDFYIENEIKEVENTEDNHVSNRLSSIRKKIMEDKDIKNNFNNTNRIEHIKLEDNLSDINKNLPDKSLLDSYDIDRNRLFETEKENECNIYIPNFKVKRTLPKE